MDTKHPHRRRLRRGLAFESLESRLLLSADLLPAADVLATETSLVPAEHRALQAFDPAPSVSMRLEAHEVVFIDGAIADRERLLADFMRATGPDRAIEIVVLDPARDGIAQIGEGLAARKGLTVVHVLSHGRDGAIDLGATTLDAAALAGRADAIAGWAGAFAADGDLLLFGCDVADTVRGEGFLGELARLTGADVAASDDATGDAARGGDWDLEFATGAIEAALAPLAEAPWGGLLATEVLDWDDPAIDWPDGSVGSSDFLVGGANVTVTVTDPAGRLNNGSPDDALVDLGGLGAIEQGLYVSSTGFNANESSTVTIDFAHPGGVSNVSFTIFDIDRGGGPNFIDEVQASFNAPLGVTLSIVDGPNNTIVNGDTVRGTATTPSTGVGSGDANATFTFTGSGITQISLIYRNFGGATGQSITLHDISFDPTPTASDRTVATNEDSTHSFAAGDFGFADVGGDTLQAVRITQLESAGSLQLNGVDVVANQVVSIADINANLLTFAPVPDANGAPHANFRFQVGDGASFSVADYQMRVDVTAVNDAPTVAAPAVLEVVEDVTSPLLGISFGDVDAGTGLVTATFTVAQGTLSATAGGGVAVGGTATARTLTGALAAINAFLAGGGLGYTTVLDGNAPVALTASLDDLGNSGAGGPLASPKANVTLNVIPVNDAPVLGSVALNVDAGGTVVLTGTNTSATDVDDAPSSLVFFIASLQNGRFELAGNPGVPVLAFTQGAVGAGEVKFVHTDPLRPPSYLVFVTDGAATVGPGIVALTFRPLGEPGGASQGARDDGTLPAVSFASGALDTSGNGLSAPFAIRFNRQAVVPTDGGGADVTEAEPPPAAAGTRQSLATPGTVWELRSRGIAYPDLGFGEMDKLPTKIPPIDFGIAPQRPHEEPRGLTVALDAVRTAGLVVSVGAAWWAARASGLISSLLAITPTWRHIDPMPVLGRDHDEEAGGWENPVGEEAAKEDATADEMFDGKTKQSPSA